VLADAAFDSEAHHRFAREVLGIRSSVIPINARGHDTAPKGKYRGQIGPAVPAPARGEPAQARVRPAVAGRERLLAPTRRCRGRALRGQPHPRVLPPRPHAQPNAPRGRQVRRFQQSKTGSIIILAFQRPTLGSTVALFSL
jgi:hypothetical protein